MTIVGRGARLKCRPTEARTQEAQSSLKEQRPEKDSPGRGPAKTFARASYRIRSFSGRGHKRLPSAQSGGVVESPGLFGGRQQPLRSDEYGN